MAHDAAGGVEHGPMDGKGDILGDVQRRHQFLGFLGVDEVALHAVELGGGDGHAGRLHGRFAVHQVEVAAVVEHQVEVQLFGQHRPQVQGFLIERHIILRALVGPNDRRVAPGAAESDVALFNDGHIRDTVLLGQVISRGQTVKATADDHRIVAGLQSGFVAPQGLGFPEHTLSLHRYKMKNVWVKKNHQTTSWGGWYLNEIKYVNIKIEI
jgi:hypothetical protein